MRRRVKTSNSNFKTIKSFLSTNNSHLSCDVLVVDECSTVRNHDMLKVLEKAQFRVLILVGDVYQIESITFGNWFSSHLVMKERLVLNIINYFEEANVDFEHSSFWVKNKLLLIMFYLYEYERNDSNYMILKSVLHKFLPKDLEIIKSDWKIIHDKIVNGEAQNISEADTMYLGACAKGADAASSYREQPNSPVKARQRAYCLKASYMNSFVDKVFQNKTYDEIVSYDEIKGHSFEYLIRLRLCNYFGKTEAELLNQFGINKTAKSRFNLLCAKMLGINGSINDSDEFKKANIELKTIRVEENETIREHMSFPHFVYKDIVNQDWEDSDIFNKFYSTKFLFVIFKKTNGEYRLSNVKLWNMPYQDITLEYALSGYRKIR